jgi:putative ABC transport system permease protein
VLRETGSEEDNAIIMDREELERVASRSGQLNLVEVAAADSGAVDAIVRQIGQALPAVAVTSVKQALEFNAQANSFLAEFGLAATFLVVAVAALIVILTMLTAVRERQREIGVFRALGFRQRDVAALLFRESLLVGGAAAIAGALLGLVGAAYGPRLVRGLALDFVPSPLVVVGGMGLSIVLSVLATLYPAYLAARLDPSLALKRL